MRYVCIRCRDTWIVGETTDEPSGGLCDRCITQYVRKKQESQGFSDCFRRATESCSNKECSYWEPCIRDSANCEDKEGNG